MALMFARKTQGRRDWRLAGGLLASSLLAALSAAASETSLRDAVQPITAVELGPRPFWLAEALPDGELRDSLQRCNTENIRPHPFSIGHRGAPLQFPEHTRESYLAAARMGAGILECDVSFTRDKELVCRHSQCDLHTTTNILETDLAARCSIPPDRNSKTPYANVRCCTSDLTLAEFRTLVGKMDAGNPDARTLEEYLDATASWRTDGYASRGTLMTHAESIALFDKLGVGMTPELKQDLGAGEAIGFSRQEQADKLLQEYRDANIDPSRVWPQTFHFDDIQHWVRSAPDFADQLVMLDGRYTTRGFDPMSPASWRPSMQTLVDAGVQWLAPPLWVLLTTEDGAMAPSAYASAAKEAGLELITWTLERSGPLNQRNRGGWYYQSVAPLIRDDSDVFKVLDVLARNVGVAGVFSDWPATTSYYAHCRL